ncbi:sugar kinase [Lacticaseibacillus casei]|uniref:sugar kinase n=1 Tax=Lacticaseibacillus casei TaxID=1582 RepID=UPI001108E81F|nr:sugar kinase [Lacticaseibacillus casei]TLQ50308.1 sugar kinase [Lacticaseibacillus casei]
MTKVLTFGEMMLRLKPYDHQRILQASGFEANYGGSEANVAVSLALLGDQAQYVTKLPDNALGDTARNTIRGLGVDTHKILRGGPRLGIYFFEKGASVRNTNVVYDRAGSSFATAEADEFDWASLLKDVAYFYFSGITPAISPAMKTAIESAVKYCAAHDITVVCDMNYRGKMWTPAEAQDFFGKVMPYITIVLANDEDFEATLGIKAFDGNMETGMLQVMKQWPNVKTVASVVRNIHSVEDSWWTGLLAENGKTYQGPTFHMHVMEGVASGDAFGAGLMHATLHDFDPQAKINYAISASVLKLTISGDLNLITDADVRAVMATGSGVDR